ncbi:MAG: hypothetical protein JNM93_00160 [Bacteriovoracaceae bacterium]|nr:hypothetical protein [Bacteriovoracaceae bacterium]
MENEFYKKFNIQNAAQLTPTNEPVVEDFGAIVQLQEHQNYINYLDKTNKLESINNAILEFGLNLTMGRHTIDYIHFKKELCEELIKNDHLKKQIFKVAKKISSKKYHKFYSEDYSLWLSNGLNSLLEKLSNEENDYLKSIGLPNKPATSIDSRAKNKLIYQLSEICKTQRNKRDNNEFYRLLIFLSENSKTKGTFKEVGLSTSGTIEQLINRCNSYIDTHLSNSPN